MANKEENKKEIKKSIEEVKKKQLKAKIRKEEHISKSENEYAMIRPIGGEKKNARQAEKPVAKPARIISQESDRYPPEMSRISAPKIESTQPEFNPKEVSKVSIQDVEEKPEKTTHPYSQGPLQGQFPGKEDRINLSGIKQVEQPQRAPQSQFPSEQQPKRPSTEKIGEHPRGPGSFEHLRDNFLEQVAPLPAKPGGMAEPDKKQRKEIKNLRR